MIEMPSRSVTRFFIPMIDVLTLLFCIYLLMPMVSPTDDSEPDEVRRAREAKLRELEAQLLGKDRTGEEIPAKLRADIEKLRREKAEALKNLLAPRVLEIDATDGQLYYRGSGGARVEVASQADAQEMIRRDQERTGAQKKELLYMILYPRDPKSAYPTVGQRRSYDAWFKDVAMAYDKPGQEPGGTP
jgi:hypothetical protein